jgi:diguanylate cyclase (GGDEF)-like protein
MRTKEPAFITDTSDDADYLSAHHAVSSEISLPLLADGAFRGVLNVEADAGSPLDRSDLAAMSLVAERIASALALAERHLEAVARAKQYERLTLAAAELTRTLEPDEVRGRITELVARVIPGDVTMLVLRGPSGEYRLMKMRGGDERYVGVRIEPGEGLSGRAIEQRAMVVDTVERSQFPRAARAAAVPDTMVGCAVPLVHGDEVLGALTVARYDVAAGFTALEQEVIPILGAQIGLALANADLHEQVAQASVRDPLTGLHNRRHLDGALARLEASRLRREPSDRPPVAAIIFDLDHFGSINKQYGHQVGDDILRRFGAILTRWFRASDVIGRYGGEEFLAVLEGASRDEAVTLADGIRRELAHARFELPDGSTISATVSAGCSGLGPDVGSLGALVEVADVALSLAKRAGRDQVVAA